MTNGPPPPLPPALTLVEKLYAVHNINNLVPVKLNMDEINYSSWCYFFKIHCNNFGVLKHIEFTTTDSSSSMQPTDEWLTADSIVKSWIILTLAPTLQGRLIQANPPTAKDAWDQVEKIFLDNKRTRTIALKGELRVLQMGDLSADAFFRKIESIVTLLNDLGSSMSDDDIVTYAINGLSEKYANLATIIAHKDPFPNLETMRSMVQTEEMRLNSRSPTLSTDTTSAAPQVLLTETTSSRGQDSRNNRDTRNNTSTEVCQNFRRGFCQWGTNCCFLHVAERGSNRNSNNNSRGSFFQSNTRTGSTNVLSNGSGGINLAGQQQLLTLLQAQNSLLAQYGLTTPLAQQQTHVPCVVGSRPSAPPGFQPVQQTPHSFTPQQQALYTTTVHGSPSQSTLPGQETLLPQAFNTMTLQDPANANWNMDTGLLDPSNSTLM